VLGPRWECWWRTVVQFLDSGAKKWVGIGHEGGSPEQSRGSRGLGKSDAVRRGTGGREQEDVYLLPDGITAIRVEKASAGEPFDVSKKRWKCFSIGGA